MSWRRLLKELIRISKKQSFNDMFKWLLVLAAYLPFQLALNPAEGIDLASIRVFILIFFLVWLAEGLRRKRINIKNRLTTGLAVVFLSLSLFSVMMAENIDWSWRKILFLFSVFPLYFIAPDIINSREKAVKTIKVIVCSSATAAVIGIAQFLFQFIVGIEAVYKFWAQYVATPFLGKTFSAAVMEYPSWLVNISGKTYLRATSVFPDPHMFSFYLGLVIPFSAGLYWENKNKMALFSFGLLLLADLFTFSRGGYGGLLVGFLVTLFIFWKKLESKTRVASIVAIIMVIGLMLFSNPISERFYSSFSAREGSNQGRMAMWQKAAEVARDNPVLGVGIGNYPLEVKPTAIYREPIYAHNVYLDIAAESGIFNSIVWMAFLAAATWNFWRKGRKDKIFLAGVASMLIFSAHSLADTAIYSPVVLTLLLLVVSLSHREAKNNLEKYS